MHSPATTITRQELARKVWEVPITRLAAEYGISDVALGKLCRKSSIKCPPRGYWAKPAAVRARTKPKLRPDEPHGATIILSIVPSRGGRRANADPIEIAIPKRLRSPHPAVAELLARHEDIRKRYAEEWAPWVKQHLPERANDQDERRRLRLLDALLNALDLHGGTVASDGKSFSYREESIEFWLHGGKQLSFVIDTHLAPGAQRSWQETAGRPMERLLPAILGSLLAGAGFLADQREMHARARHLAALEDAQKRAAARLLENEEKTWRALVDMAKQADECESVKRLLSRLRAAGSVSPDFIEWAEMKLQNLESRLRDVDALVARLQR